MKSRPLHRAFSGLALSAALLGAAAEAPAVPPPRAAPPAESAEDQAATRHFKEGQRLFRLAKYREAYEEFKLAMEHRRDIESMADAAYSLQQLGRYDEALDLYEDLARELPHLDAARQKKVARARAELEKRIGWLVLAGDAPAGATVYIDGRRRAKLPLDGPMRVGEGTHEVRVEKEGYGEKDGFTPITATLTVKAGQSPHELTLVATARKGRLSVGEKHNWGLRVEIDGKDEGTSPWEGVVATGEHRVRLRGFVGVETVAECAAPKAGPDGKPAVAAEGIKMESPEETAVVKLFETTQVMLGADDMDASLRIESDAPGAKIAIDANDMAVTADRGVSRWDGRLPLGDHSVSISAPGFVGVTRQVKIERRQQRVLDVHLERVPRPEDRQVRAVRNGVAGAGLGLGAAGLGLFAVTGALALDKVNGLKASCPGQSCYLRSNGDIEAANALGTASTIGLVVGGLGIAAGAVVLLTVRPPAETEEKDGKKGPPRPAPGPSASLGVGLGSLTLEGSF